MKVKYPENIYTIDARENVLLEILTTKFKLSTQQIFREIRGLFRQTIDKLNEKNIKYEQLKNALIPLIERKEIGLVFDTNQIKSKMYGNEAFSWVLPLLETDITLSCLCGDYIGKKENQEFLKSVFMEEINKINDFEYQHSSQFFIIYFNNLSERQFNSLVDGLSNYQPFSGFFDLSFGSPIKTILSTLLIRLFVKTKMTILLRNEENEDGNSTLYPFKEFGYKCLGIEATSYGIFLSYKIEREVLPGFEIDTDMSINAISENALNIQNFTLVIEENKLKYLLDNKIGNLERANLHTLSRNELAEFIKGKILKNYLYNLSYSDEYKTMKFNILIELPRNDNNHSMKLLTALEYIESTRELRLITLF